MILVDTSVWIDHLKRGDARLVAALEQAEVATHPFVVGELACGNLRDRSAILSLLGALPSVSRATDDEALAMVERRGLMGRGIGWIDVHLLAAAMLGDMSLWTRDARLAAVADSLGFLHANAN